jgi:PAS domain S-box-containing protein
MTTRRRVFVPILLVVFGVEVVIRIVLRTWLPLSVLAEASVGALALTIVSGPLLWLIVVKRIALNAEAEKFRADARVASILAASIDGIITIDAAGTVTHFNAGAEKIFGYPASEIINRNISVLIPEHFHSAHEQHVDRFATGAICSRAMGEILATEGRRKSGEQFLVDVSISRLAVDGKVMLTAVVRDVTERQRAETALRQAESRLRAVLNSAPLTIFATDASGVFTLSDGQGLQRVGLKPGENVGVSAIELFGSLPFVDDSGAVTAGADVVRRVLLGETIAAKSQLGDITFENRIVPMRDGEGKIVGIVGVSTDVTDSVASEAGLRDREARLAAIFDHASDAMLLLSVDADGKVRVADANRSFITRIRVVREVTKADLLGLSFEELALGIYKRPPEVLAQYQESLRRVIDTRAPLTFEHMAIFATGPFFAEVMLVPILDGAGACVQILWSSHDVTDAVRARQQLVESTKELRALAAHLDTVREDERAQLARNLHDDLGQNLTALKLDLRTVRRRVAEGAKIPPASLDAMDELIDGLIATSRNVGSELHAPILEGYGLRDSVESQAAEFSKHTGIPCAVTCTPIDPHVEDRTALVLYRIVQESLTNVTRHAAATAVTIAIRAAGDDLRLLVEDNGRGFTAQHLPGGRFGIIGMRERALALGGKFAIGAGVNGGTAVEIVVPLRTRALAEGGA